MCLLVQMAIMHRRDVSGPLHYMSRDHRGYKLGQVLQHKPTVQLKDDVNRSGLSDGKKKISYRRSL